jgi:CheY-like chemotaxis protein
LTKRGHDVTVAVNGLEAVTAVERESFDVVLMDVQMPEMGGLEATAAIRERERRTGGHVRIVALTAHAMKGDEERCLAAGMDGYLKKPIDRLELFAAVELGSSSVAPAGTAAWDRPFDPAEMLEWLGDDKVLGHEVVGLFLEECPKLLAAIKTAVDHADARQLYVGAHTLKGAAGNLTARRLAEAARALEVLGREASLDNTAVAWARLDREAQQILATLRETDRQFTAEAACAS